MAAGTPSTTGLAPASVAGSYRPFLDGLRAVAVYLVVLFHAGSDRFDGGYVGVDVFFVLSGYLVTLLLLRDLVGAGRIDLRRFYARRFRRLLPASFVMLIVTAVVFSAIATPVAVADAESGFQAAFLYVANWHFIRESSDYFGADLTTNPVLHFWSLAVEEQFYLLWPLLLGGLFALTRRTGDRQRRAAQGLVLAAAAVSVAWAWHLKTGDPNRAYYGTDTRAYQLLAGALVALTPGLITRLVPYRRVAGGAALGALAGLVVIASSWTSLDAIERGIAVCALAVVLIIALEASRGGVVQRALSLDPIAYLGKISYGTYLWHWPVILIMDASFDLSTASTIALTTLIATALASLSYQILEHPIRRSPSLDRLRVPVIATGLAISVASALVLIPNITDDPYRGSEAVPQGAAVGATPVPADLDWQGAQQDVSDFPSCTPDDLDPCALVKGTGPHILLLGDSHARMYIPTFQKIAEDRGLTFSAAVAPACPWQAGLQYLQDPEACRAHQRDVYSGVVDELDPDLVVVANRTFDDPQSPLFVADEEAGRLPPRSQEYLDSVAARTDETLETIRADGRQVLVMEPIPVAPRDEDPVVCLSAAAFVDECRYVATTEPTPVEQIYREAANADDGVWGLDLDRLVCPFFPICDPIVNGLIVKRDTSHLTSRFALTIADEVGQFLDDNGILSA